ncbi:penicillin-binding transpeptidase domain-containing protein [Paenibacillus hemerocallicola]|uniref:Penicillin-binding transpeptidase domain-containing protein n=1 Tax=Paenibacillus hemerocallicola TaxID=1172614 RepID=A0A5C4TGX5_9BACL|nr:penicillin-binding transpeptidase domain-containing protein [Paenibacillus hemerocallicola]TNJ67730.1 penicillin-binding transpeptidase domain-containing protein [Paenibacillus hemerocallicola]
MMRKRQWHMPVLLLFVALTACDKQEEPPLEAFKAYLTDWQQLNLEAMYDRLTPEAQARITRETFAERYRNIYDGIEAKQLAVTNTYRDLEEIGKSEAEIALDYHVEMDTVAGTLRFDHRMKLLKTKVDKRTEWKVEWDPSLLFPQLGEGDKVRVQSTKGERGEILDSSGKGLAINGAGIQIGVVPGKLGDAAEQSKEKLAGMLKMAKGDIDKKLNASWVKPDVFVPLAFVPEEEANRYLEIPGTDYQKKKIRVYPYAEAAAHLTGYIGEISAEQLAKRKDGQYEAGDWIGQAGLEQLCEERLRGKDGARIAITGADGKEKAVLARTEAMTGETIKLTIDAELQRSIYDEFGKDAGSAAAIRPLTGEIAALASSPSYDPNAFVRGISREQYDQWNNDPQKPFLNRFSKGYSPGSAFKIVTAAIGLDTKTLDPAEARPITGLAWTLDRSWGNYYITRVHDTNPVRLMDALVHSDNIYFAQTALKIGTKTFAEAAGKFGIGEELPIPYPFKKSQLSNKGIQNDIQLADSGYGQGEVIITSLHAALIFSALVNDGNIVYPVLTDEDGSNHSNIWKRQAMTAETAALLRNDLIRAVSTPGGAGYGAYIPGASIAGKTGTAELKQSKEENGKENGWFVGFDSADPELLLSIMVEDVKGRGGSGYVTKKVKRIFQQALQQ